MKKPFKPAGRFPVLARYQQVINQQQRLLIQIKSILPENLAGHVQYCVVSGKKLVLYTASAIWSSQLRFYQQAILHKAIEADWPQLQRVQIKVIPERVVPRSTRKPRLPSPENIALIQQTAQNQKDKKLKHALARLGETLAKKQSA